MSPAPGSTPASVYKTFMFMEFAGEVPEYEQMHRAPCIQNTLEEARVRLEQVEQRPRRKASPLLVRIVEALESEVCDEEAEAVHPGPTRGSGSSSCGRACASTTHKGCRRPQWMSAGWAWRQRSTGRRPADLDGRCRCYPSMSPSMRG